MRRGVNQIPGGKALAKNQQTQPHMTPNLRIEPGPHDYKICLQTLKDSFIFLSLSVTPDPLLLLVCYSVSLLFAPSFCLISTCLTASLFPTLLYLLPYNWLLISYSSQISFLIPACWCAFLSCFPFNPCHLTSQFPPFLNFLLRSPCSFCMYLQVFFISVRHHGTNSSY